MGNLERGGKDMLYAPEEFYPKFLNMVLKFVLKGRVRSTTRRVMVYTDSLPMKSKKDAEIVSNSIKAACRLHRLNIQFTVMHHTAASNWWTQVSWAMNRKWEHGDTTFYDLLRPRLAPAELALMNQGNGITYY